MGEPLSSVIHFTGISISPWLARINSLSRISVSPNLEQTDKTEPVMHTDGIKEDPSIPWNCGSSHIDSISDLKKQNLILSHPLMPVGE